MNTKRDHLKYVAHRGLFNIDCDRIIFSPEEIQILEKWGHWFMALVSGELKPFTKAQERFVKVMKGPLEPLTTEEVARFKYCGRKAVKKEYGDCLRVRYEA